ncbi:hypothetical protein F2Q70_00029320 [Brassica cretica]|uniref:Uncharacterized protein n=1 Tax=Brassica cretica TaxID=69181 RepID=A0A8S9FNA2_BRACR|nr:hypothetical protein F2Q70_00029320 [Brassica cretica]
MMHPSPSPSQRDHSNLYATRSTLNSKWNSNNPTHKTTQNSKWNLNKPTHSVLGEKQLVDQRGLGQNPIDDLTGVDWTDLDLDRNSASP